LICIKTVLFIYSWPMCSRIH